MADNSYWYFHKEAIKQLKKCLIYLEGSEKELINKSINKHKVELAKYNSTFDIKDYSKREYSMNHNVLHKYVFKDLCLWIDDVFGKGCRDLQTLSCTSGCQMSKKELNYLHASEYLSELQYNIPHHIVCANILKNRSENSQSMIGKVILECLKTEALKDFNNKYSNIKEVLTNKFKKYETSK